MRSSWSLVVASLFVGSFARAQAKPVERCMANFEEAQLKEKRGKLVDAEELYGACASTQCPSMIRTDCTAKRDEMQRRVPTVTFVVRDASGNDVDAKVDVDGKPLEDRIHARPIDPGEHTVSWVVAGRPPASQKITLVEGEKARVITLTAKDAKDAPSTSTTQTTTTTKDRSSEGPSIVGPAILVSGGVILLGIAVVSQLNAVAEDDKASEFRAKAIAPNTPATERNELIASADSRSDAAARNQLVALVTGIGGLLCIGGGVVWYVVTRSNAPPKTSFTPLVGPGYAGLGYALSF